MMKLLFIFAVLWNSNDPLTIARVNKLKSEAEKAYQNGNYQVAAEKFSMLYDSLGVTEDEIALNLAHSYYALKDSSKAKTAYQQLTASSNNKLKSIAYQQLGVMAKSPQTLKQSLAYLKSALKADPTNEEARYNYEVVKKLLDQQQEQNKDQNQDQQNKDQQNKDQKQNQDQQQQDQQKQDQEKQDQQQQDQENKEQQQQDQKQQEGQEGEQEKEQQKQQQQEGEQSEDEQRKNREMNTRKKLEEMDISEEKAQMILEAMRNNEIQYIQQQKRKATKSPNSGKPDW